MLRAASGLSPATTIDGTTHAAALGDAVWIDLIDPTETERAEVERVTGLRVPAAAEIAEIESSSRLVERDGVMTLSTPMVSRGTDEGLRVSPLGFVVSRDRLLTLRYGGSRVFDNFAADWRRADHPADAAGCGGMQPFLGLMEAMVDRLADVLEKTGADLETLSGRVFAVSASDSSGRRRDAFLRGALTEVGRTGTLISHVRDGLLGLVRIVRFVRETAAGWLRETETSRLKVLDSDVASLNDYDTQLTNKVQFLLDAIMGFISIEQNNIFKVLTVVSIVGIPPTFIASLYGMNFKDMPELGWQYGYYYALALIAVSILVPVVWFRRKGWL
jgi:magnesium transporter